MFCQWFEYQHHPMLMIFATNLSSGIELAVPLEIKHHPLAFETIYFWRITGHLEDHLSAAGNMPRGVAVTAQKIGTMAQPDNPYFASHRFFSLACPRAHNWRTHAAQSTDIEQRVVDRPIVNPISVC